MLPIGRAETSVGRRFLGSSRREPKLACVRWRPRHGFAIAQVGKTIYAVSGVNNAGAAGTLSVFPSTRSTSPDNTICSSRMSYLMPIVDSDGSDAAMLLRVGCAWKAPRTAGRPQISRSKPQAATLVGSTSSTLSERAMGIARGFMASGTSRTRSM